MVLWKVELIKSIVNFVFNYFVLNRDFNFYKNDFLDIFAEDNDWKASKDELKNNWYLTTKSDLLNEIISNTGDIDIDEKKFIIDHNFNVLDLGSQDQIQEIWNIDAKRDLMKLANIITSGKPAKPSPNEKLFPCPV